VNEFSWMTKDRRKFLETLGQACQKTSWQVHAYYLMENEELKRRGWDRKRVEAAAQGRSEQGQVARRLRKETLTQPKAKQLLRIAAILILHGHTPGKSTKSR